jgi:hypothetical protein
VDTCHSRGREKTAESPPPGAGREHTYEIGSLEIAQRMFRVWQTLEEVRGL